MSREFEMDGHTYSIGLMDVRDQLDIAAILSPLLVPIARMQMEDNTISRLMGSGDDAEKKQIAMKALFENVEELMKMIRDMESRQRSEILEKCFKVVKRKVPNTSSWVPIWNESADRFQFEELNELGLSLRICGEVISDKLRSFFSAGQPK